MTLRLIVRLSVVVMATVVVLSAFGMVWTTTLLHQLTARIEENVESVQAGGEIELSLVKHARAANLAALTNDPRYRGQVSGAEADLRLWQSIAGEYVGNRNEAAALSDLQNKVDRYLAEQRRLMTAGLSATEAYLHLEPTLDMARQAAKNLRAINIAQAAEHQREAAFWDRTANWMGAVVILILVVGVLGVMIGLERRVFGPLLAIRDAIDGFANRDFSSRAVEHGASELRQIASVFNRMAEMLQRHRQQQLAFLAGVAHDLRNPLYAITLLIASTRRAGDEDPQRMKAVIDVVSRQIDLVSRMIADLLDATRIEAGQLEMRFEANDLREIVRHSVDLFRPLSQRHEIVLELPARPVPVCADALRLEQVMNNLLSNAIKYSPDGGLIEVVVSESCSVCVVDPGIGISAADQPRLFEPFRRGTTSAETAPGVGLGLAVARRIVEAHGGRIEVQSAPSRGSVFTVHLHGAAVPTEPGDVLSTGVHPV